MSLRRAILPLLWLSGMAGLMHEVIWLRLFSLTFGNTAQAGAVVLGCFMGGLALGAWWFGRRAETSAQPYRLYGRLELGIAAAAAALLAGYVGADRIYAAVFRATGPDSPALAICRAAIAAALMAVPTTLMGAPVPVLVRAAAPDPSDSGRRAGLLYAVNTLGGVAGVLLAGFAAIRWWGVWATAGLAIGLNLAAGVVALALARSAASSPPPPAPVAPSPAAAEGQRLAWALAAALGFCSLALEVLYVRLIVFAVEHTIHAWTMILATYLTGLALGSALTARASRRRPAPLADACRCLLGMAVAAWAYLVAARWLERQLTALTEYLGDAGAAAWQPLQLGLVALTLLPPALLSGAAFPFLVRAWVGPDRAVGRRTGGLYAANTAAGVAGSLAAGFVLLPLLGAQWAWFGVAALLAAAAAAVLIRLAPRRLGSATWAAGAALAAGLAATAPGPHLLADLLLARSPAGARVLMTHEDAAATVLVAAQDEERLLMVNNVAVAGLKDRAMRTSQILQGFYPMAAHRSPRRVVQIGFGSGETASVVAQTGPAVFDVIELCPGVFAAGRFFHAVNFEVERAALPRKIIMDGKNYLKLTPNKYDVVMNDCTHPLYVGNAALYGRDHFAAARQALADDGVMTSWLPIYQLETSSVRSIINTFASVFPNCGLIYAPNCLNNHALLIGKKRPGPLLSLARVQALLSQKDLRRRLADIGVNQALDLVNFIVLGPQGIAAHFRDAPLNTDDHPILEFDVARRPRLDPYDYWRNVRYLASLQEDPLSSVDLDGAADVDSLLAAQPARRRATDQVLRVIGDNDLYPERAAAMIDEAAAMSPGLPGVNFLKEEIRNAPGRGRQPPAAAGSKARQQQVEALMRAGQIERAAAALEREVKRNPRNFKALGALAQMRLQQGDAAGGAKLLKEVLTLDPDNAPAMWMLGDLAARRRDWPQAEARYRAALERFGPAPGLYAALGQLKRATGDPDGALDWLREGLRWFPDETSLLLAYAEGLADLGRREDALQAVQRVLELAPGDWRAQMMWRRMTTPPAQPSM